ncbi:TPA: magnesium chelatase, partial [Burkholderia multivorans]|nr:magnesium chelatase [Burkholderia multivorans]
GHDDATHRDTRERLPRDTAPSPDDAGASHGDWGYLPPASAGLRDVKAVVPLPLKKR